MNLILETLAGPSGKFAYQIPMAQSLAAALETYNGALNASGMGIGKTHSSLAAVLLSSRRAAVICPKPCVAGWERAFAHFNAKPVFIGGYDEVKRGSKYYHPSRGWNVPDGTVIIWDEAHACKGGMDTQNGQMLGSAWKAKLPCLMLSATIAENPAEMWASGQVLGLHDGSTSGFEGWLRKNGCQWNDERKRWWFPDNQRHKLEAIRAHMFGGDTPRGVRVSVESLGDAFPPSDIKCIAVDLPDADKAKIDRAWNACSEMERRMRNQRIPEWRIIQLKQQTWQRAFEISQTAKVNYLMEKAVSGVNAGYSVPIFCNYTSTREALMTGLHTKCGIYGGQSPIIRERHRMDFQQDRQRIIVCQIQSGGTGLDLHDVESDFPRYSFIMMGPKWSLVEQACGRVRRAGGGPSNQRIIYAAGTIESTMCKKHVAKLANLHALIGEGTEIEIES